MDGWMDGYTVLYPPFFLGGEGGAGKAPGGGGGWLWFRYCFSVLYIHGIRERGNIPNTKASTGLLGSGRVG